MVSTRRLSAALALGLLLCPALQAATEAELREQQERQRLIQADTDHIVRRMSTMLRVMQFYGIDKSGEKKMLEEMATTLSGLSKQQMAEVIRRLDEAALASDEKQSAKSVEAAYDQHRRILDTLKDMLARFDAVKDLEQAADRFDKQAKQQLGLHLQNSQMIRDLTALQNPDLSHTRKLYIGKRIRGSGGLLNRGQGDEQGDLSRDLANLIKQVEQLKGKLPAEQLARVQAMEKLLGEYRLRENVELAASKLRAMGDPSSRLALYKVAQDLQWKNAGQLKEMARVLRVPADTLAALRAARERIDEALAKQEAIREETKDKKEPEKKKEEAKKSSFAELRPNVPRIENGRRSDMEKSIREAQAVEKNSELSQKQAEVEFDTKDTADLLKPLAKETAEKVSKAEQAMKESKEALAKNDAKKAETPQEKASKELKEARQDLDKMIAAAEKEKTDPLAALQKAAEDLDKVIKDQTETRDQTKQTAMEKQERKLPELAKKQKELAQRTEMLKETPLPTKEKAEAALDKANQAMKEATKALDKKTTPEAVAKQDKALDALKEARKEIGDKLAEVEKRRDDLAKLEEAAKKLDDLAGKEKNVAQKADAMAQKPAADKDGAKQLAKDQGDLKPKANELAKELNKTAPDAAQKVAESTKNMEAAKKGLDKNDAKPAAQEADMAAKKLDAAQKSLTKAMDNLKGKEIADQAAMQKNVAPEGAAQQIAKALEQTEKAAEFAKQAAMAQPQKGQPDLAKMQADIAKQADKMKLKDVGAEAKEAAEQLKKGDLNKAIEQQETTLAKLQQAAAKGDTPPPEGEPMTKPGTAKPGEAKAGEAPAQAKDNQAKAGETKMPDETPLPGEPKPAQAKAGPPRAAEKKPAQAKASAPKAKTGAPKDGMGEAKDAPAQAAQAKTGEPMEGQAKAGNKPDESKPMAQAKDQGEKMPLAQAKEQGPETPQAKNPGELAKAQKELMDATKALAQSQQANQAAQAALAQAQAQAPKTVQPQLKEAAKELAQANQKLQDAKPVQAGEAQKEAAAKLGEALETLNSALAQMGQPQVKPGQPNTQAPAPPMTAQAPPMGEGPPMADGPPMGDAPPMPGQPGPPKTPNPGQEKNTTKGNGDRLADGKLSNSPSKLSQVNGDGSFLHLPPRQREMIRQAISGNLPPEYAGLIQQYYINIARGRPAAGTPGSAAAAPGPR
jgi:hypothetical protein